MAHSVDTPLSHIPAAARRPRRPGPFGTLLRYFDLHRQRRSLGRLDAHRLRDIGLTETQARTEARKALWSAPAHWRD